MTISPWQRRVQRAQELAGRHAFAAEILGFYIRVAGFQEELYRRLESEGPVAQAASQFGPPHSQTVIDGFEQLLRLVETHGPARLAGVARELLRSGREAWAQLLDTCWNKTESPTAAEEFLARAVLQPYAEFARSRLKTTTDGYSQRLCPFCSRKPGLGVLRQQGDGARRALICSFCLAEWDFRRLVCPGCGEENDAKLPVYSASEFDYIRIESCDTCKTYIKTVDLTKNGVAEPIVDEIAAAPLDLWAQERGYSKLQPNLMGM